MVAWPPDSVKANVSVVGRFVDVIYNASPSMETAVIIGLGNPGARYESTRHNVGFICIDELARLFSARFTSSRCRSYVADARAHGKRIVLAKPRTYMNCAGEAAVCLVRAERILPEQMVVVYDDMDLPLGRVRIRPSGSHGGHNGMRSIIEALGTDGFPRVRIGIGRPVSEGSHRNDIDYVLGRFSREEEDAIGAAVDTVRDALDCILSDGMDVAMNRFN